MGKSAALLPTDADCVADSQAMQDFRGQLAESHRELLQSEECYRQLAAASSGIVWVANPDGTFTRDCPSWHIFSGQTHEQGKGFGWTAAVHPDDLPRVLTIWRQTLASGTTYQAEYRLRRHDGVYRLFSVRAVPVYEADGTLREWVGTGTDITEQRATEAALHGQPGKIPPARR